MSERDGPVVAIDGPAGSGKSTLARGLAVELDLPYVNTGLMYRALTARALRAGLDVNDGAALAEAAGEVAFDLDLTATPPSLLIDGRAPGEDLVAPDVEAKVSAVSSHPAVRRAMRDAQRRLGSGGAVMEGRDIGSVIFPDAAVKIFLQAVPSERVSRRALQRRHRHARDDTLTRRDELDSKVNPFVPAEGAFVIDTTGRSIEEVLEEAMRIVRDRLASWGDA